MQILRKVCRTLHRESRAESRAKIGYFTARTFAFLFFGTSSNFLETAENLLLPEPCREVDGAARLTAPRGRQRRAAQEDEATNGSEDLQNSAQTAVQGQQVSPKSVKNFHIPPKS